MMYRHCSEIYSLDDLMPAGTIQLSIFNAFCSSKIASNFTKDDYSEWESLEPILEFLKSSSNEHDSSQERALIDEVNLLTKHHFIRPLWKRFNQSTLHIQIYIIPQDHPARPKTILPKSQQGIIAEAQRCLLSLLSCTNRAPCAWDNPCHPSDNFESFLPLSENITLAEIYTHLPSPKMELISFLKDVDPRVRKCYLQTMTRKPPGMKSKLYKYQVRTAACMLQREMQPCLIPDLSYVPIRGVKGHLVFYLQPATMEILRGPLPRYAVPAGGILCEEMGTGKTCIVLGLIAATKGHLSQPEEGSWKMSEKCILTELALRTFPFPSFQEAREMAAQEISHGPFPSLRELLIHYIRTCPIPLKYQKKNLPPHLRRSLLACVPFYRMDSMKPSEELRISPRRVPLRIRWRQFYLTSATLVVVPQAIVAQWNSEINKHCDTKVVRVLYLGDDSKAEQLPPAPKLASKYDIVLLTHEGFSRYKERKGELTRETYCQCPTDSLSRIPKCVCQQNMCSPLMQIRWKRLIVDEGHKTGTRSNFALTCQELNAQHRWIVTGTPTPNLMGLGLGKPEQNEDKDNGEDGEDIDINDTDGIEQSYHNEGEEDLRYPEPDQPLSRAWTKDERVDLTILGDYISRFFSFSLYSGKNEFGDKVINPVMRKKGPLFGSVAILRNIMALFMFRHQIQDIEGETPELLPVLQEKIVKLKFQPLAAMTYNVLQSVIAVNAVDSQREHQDYLFHPSSRRELRTALENLSQTLFWKVDSEIFEIDDAIQRSRTAERHAIERGVSASDLQLVRQSRKIQQKAIEDEVWSEVMYYEDHVYSIRGLSKRLYDAWSKFRGQSPINDYHWIDAERLLAMQGVIHTSPSISEAELGDMAREQIDREIRWREYLDRPRKGQYKRQRIPEKDPKLVKFSQDIVALEEEEEEDCPRRTNVGKVTSDTAGCIPNLSILKSASSKINYILRKVLKHAPKQKFLIFSSMPLSLAYLADALRLAQVQFLSYISNGMSPRQRQSSAVTFESSEKHRVLLVELKLGARGLNLTSASRIIFCEPVWRGDVESQAIKRAHRIGQKCEKLKVCGTKGTVIGATHSGCDDEVITLVMEGTYEEAIVSRRRALQNQVQQQAASFELDVSMRRVLENTTFITDEYIEDSESNVLDIPLHVVKREENIEEEEVIVTEPPPKRARVVRFAD